MMIESFDEMPKDQLTHRVLVHARGLVARGWIRFTEAQDIDGKDLHPGAEGAACFCAVGAIKRALFVHGQPHDFSVLTLETTVGQMALRRLQDITKESIPAYNDTAGRTQEDIVALFDKAIETLTKELSGV